MPVTGTKGAASSQGFGEFAKASGVPATAFIENLFSTYLYTGTGASQSINNGINLAGNGGLVWTKARNTTTNNILMDTVQGTSKYLVSSTTAGAATSSTAITSFNSNGYTLGTNTLVNSGYNYVSWAFQKQAKFFDIVTWTGNGANRTIAHNLNSVPGCIMVKRTDTTSDWSVYHQSLANTDYMLLNSSAASVTDATYWNSTTATSTVFSLGTATNVNANGGTYVAYLFASNAGGFGSAGTDNVISCGSFTTDASANATVNLGYEVQWLLIKSIGNDNWIICDNLRGMSYTNAAVRVLPNLSGVSESPGGLEQPTATGFSLNQNVNKTYIYIAIRRGPMQTPTSATSVFAPSARAGTGVAGSSTALGQITDLTIIKQRGSTQTWAWTDRLRGSGSELSSASTGLETTYSNDVTSFASLTGFSFGSGASGQVNTSATNYIDYLFRRTPGFFDQVCYTGTGSATTVNHNLGVAPELIITKMRSNSPTKWSVYAAGVGATQYLVLNTNAAPVATSTAWNNTAPTASVFSVGTTNDINGNGSLFVAYLFASLTKISKVGTYTGTGSTQTISCGFAVRFVLIKRTDTTGDWCVYDTARGMVAGTDPYLLFDSTAAEVNQNDVYTNASGFQLVSATANVNANGGTYIYFAIA